MKKKNGETRANQKNRGKERKAEQGNFSEKKQGGLPGESATGENQPSRLGKKSKTQR